MSSFELQHLKSKVTPTQLTKTRSVLLQETDSLKKKTLDQRKIFDQLKSKNTLKTLSLKKSLKDSNSILSDARIVWKSDLISLKNSFDLFQAVQLQKNLIRENLYFQLSETFSLLDLPQEHFVDKENFCGKSFCNSGFSSNCSESTLIQTMVKTIDSLKEKAKNFGSSSLDTNFKEVDQKLESSIGINVNFLGKSESESLEDESQTNEEEEIRKIEQKLESSIDTNLKYSIEIKQISLSISEQANEEINSRNSLNSIPLDNILIRNCTSSVLASKQMEKIKVPQETSIKQPEDEINDTMIGLIDNTGVNMTTLGVATLPDQIFSYEKSATYIVSEPENQEGTQEVCVSKRSWKSWLCPCIFKAKH